ncbi:alkaline phosphatase D family protein [Vibrio sp. 99-8-1]|uniref:alkaline phosphatase D family protein n=1 Tax=Vibrio sp. 99-8-1 TaxID=2607602 RepID=UPI0016A06456|nr:alkaline phosphatase D family protein [Vibrio sp. 99-8-1]NOI68199.1 alkaline phosphatase family protein [Vibrio sp. 99-8-1]
MHTLNDQMDDKIPLLLSGPIIRKSTASQLTFWLATSQPLQGSVSLYFPDQKSPFFEKTITESEQIQLGHSAWIILLQLRGEFPTDQPLQYQITTQQGDITSLSPSLLYSQEQRITFVINSRADHVLHGSCRNPHHSSQDSLVAADNKIAKQQPLDRPALLMMSGDQIYADHVAGPMLDAIHQVIPLLGLPDETFPQGSVKHSQQLYQHVETLYGRDKLLPSVKTGRDWLSNGFIERLLPSSEKAIFSSRECENHLFTFAEFIAMYLLVWSPTLWSFVDDRIEDKDFVVNGVKLTEHWQKVWHEEKQSIGAFVAGLAKVQRLMAHLPTYMIFDDHDITDDWNLTVGWEKAAYENSLSKRIIGNGLISYWLCQGWGNDPERFDGAFIDEFRQYSNEWGSEEQDRFIDRLLKFEQWHYTIETTPKVLVLDTRTRRWRSESKMNKPSGLMDWEALSELQQSMLNEPSVIIVSPAPMFGVKFIETLQRMMTWLGEPLLIDAENWMAHPGSANTLLSIFTHTKTPTNFIILSGDVHYSFAYDIKLRFHRNSLNIYQITSSGIKNEFPNGLLRFCDFMDRMLYASQSPLNWFTKRKRMKIKKRDPDIAGRHRLVNISAIGELKLDDNGKPNSVRIITASGKEIDFPPTDG